MSPVRRPWRWVFMVVLAALLPACASLTPPRTALSKHVGRSNLDVGALRIRVRDLARRFSGLLEAMADELAAHSNSPETARAMLAFKANAVPAMQGALFQPDPVAALVDAWALLAQLQDVVPTLASLASPELQAEAQRALREMESQVEAVWRGLSGSEDVSAEHARVHEWAAAHPLTRSLVARESTAPLLASVSQAPGGGLAKRAAELLEDTRDITARMDLYSASLPRAARWQAELAVVDALNGPAFQSVTAELARTVDLLDRVGGVAANTPALVARERTAVLEEVDRERLAFQDYASGERRAVMEGLGQERVAAFQQLDGLARGWVDHAFERAGKLVERIFLWLLALVGLGLVGGLVLVVLLARAWRHRPTAR